MKQQLDRTCSPQEKAYPLFDMHVATDAPSEGLVFAREELREKFEAWGFSHDELVHHGLTFGPRTATAYESCPLIDIHMSKKFSGEHGSITMKETERKVIEAMTAAGLPGYFHSEFVVKDIHVEPVTSGLMLRPFPFAPFDLARREVPKVWDFHVAAEHDAVPEALRRLLLQNEVYSLLRRKMREGREKIFEVFTLQGISSREEGQEVFDTFMKWWVESNGPPADAKLEYTTKMQTFHNPRLVPPTVDRIASDK